jgi:hypothetical protein
MAETVLENFTTLEKSKDDKSTQMEQARLEFANIYTELPPCVRKDINARIDRKKLDCGSPEAKKIITHCRDQYIKKRDYNRRLGATVRNLAKSASASAGASASVKLPPEQAAELSEDELEADEPEEEQDDPEAPAEPEESVEFDKLDAILTEPKKEMPHQGVPRTTVRQINTATGISKLFKSPDKLRRS